LGLGHLLRRYRYTHNEYPAAQCREQFFPQRVSLMDRANGPHERGMHTLLRQHWLDSDPVALAVLVIGLAIVELLALSI